MRLIRKYGFIFLIIFLVSCKSKDGDYTIFSPNEDVALGLQMHEQIMSGNNTFPVLDKESYSVAYEKLNDITNAILGSSHILHHEEFKWEVTIIDNDSILNAFCTPGGYIYVYTGLIKFLDTEDELAGVLGHEIAHADLRHATDQMTKSYGLRLIVGLLTGGQGDFFASLGMGLLNLSFSRGDEREADAYSVIYLNDTDYDPRGFASFFEKLSEKGESMGALQFLSTHPNPENRVKEIEQKWKETGSKTGKDFSLHYSELKAALNSD